MHKNCICKKCGVAFAVNRTREKEGLLYDKYWRLIKCVEKGCKGEIKSNRREKVEDIQINLYSAQNKEYINK